MRDAACREAEKGGGKMISKRMSGRSKGENEISPPPTEKNVECYDSDGVK